MSIVEYPQSRLDGLTARAFLRTKGRLQNRRRPLAFPDYIPRAGNSPAASGRPQSENEGRKGCASLTWLQEWSRDLLLPSYLKFSPVDMTQKHVAVLLPSHLVNALQSSEICELSAGNQQGAELWQHSSLGWHFSRVLHAILLLLSRGYSSATQTI